MLCPYCGGLVPVFREFYAEPIQTWPIAQQASILKRVETFPRSPWSNGIGAFMRFWSAHKIHLEPETNIFRFMIEPQGQGLGR